jgi:hypothetical protein
MARETNVTLTLTDFALFHVVAFRTRHTFIHILWSLRRTQVSSAFLLGSAYMHSLLSGFYAKEDGTSTEVVPLFRHSVNGRLRISNPSSGAPSLSKRPLENNKSKFWRRL